MTRENNRNIIPFSQFLESISSARIEQHVLKGKGFDNDTSFTEKKEYLIEYYKGVEALHSFLDGNGSIFDCIPIEQQPALKNSGKKIAKPPDISGIKSKDGIKSSGLTTLIESSLNLNVKDKFGNVRSCPPGTVPIRRITLEEIAPYQKLQNFFQKTTGGSSPVHDMSPLDSAITQVSHCHAFAFQNTSNIGGYSFLEVWNPSIEGNQIFSLSQQWYTAGTPNTPEFQSLEVGWQVYPTKYSNLSDPLVPVLFTYWTPNNYDTNGPGSYNLDDGRSFHQLSDQMAPGMAIPSWSSTSSNKVEIEVTVFLDQGNWYIYYLGDDPSHAIGYYPASIYQGGPLTFGASHIIYGGETSFLPIEGSNTRCPPMGRQRVCGTRRRKRSVSTRHSLLYRFWWYESSQPDAIDRLSTMLYSQYF